MNKTMSPCTIVRISGATPAACIVDEPAFIAPKNTPAMKMPHGVEPPSNATVIASKPMPLSIVFMNPVLRERELGIIETSEEASA